MANPTANINGREPDTDPTTIIATIGGTIARPTIGLSTTHLVFLRRTVKMSAWVFASRLMQDEIPCPTVESYEE
jgi:FAD/FMN-containing dehydrogenase